MSIAVTLPDSIDSEKLKIILIIIGGGFLLSGVVVAWVAKKILTKLLSLIVLLALGGFVFVQRKALTDCVDKVQSSAAGSTKTTCTVAGFTVTLPTDKLPGQGNSTQTG